MVDVYRTPQSELATASDSDFPPFKRFSAWGVFGLTVITFGFYLIYWLYSRTQVLNAHHSNKISVTLVNAAMAAFVLNFVASNIPDAYFESLAIAVMLVLVGIAYLVLFLVWVFSFRSRLMEAAINNGSPAFKVNPVLTFFFLGIYLQYKINQHLDSRPRA